MPRITRGLTHPSTAAGSSHPSRWRRTSGWGPWCRTPPTKTRRNKKEETKKDKKRTKKEQTEAFCEMDAHRVCTPLLTRKRMETKAARIRSEAWTEGMNGSQRGGFLLAHVCITHTHLPHTLCSLEEGCLYLIFHLLYFTHPSLYDTAVHQGQGKYPTSTVLSLDTPYTYSFYLKGRFLQSRELHTIPCEHWDIATPLIKGPGAGVSQ